MLCKIQPDLHLHLLLTISEAINASFYKDQEDEPQLIANLAKNLPELINHNHVLHFPTYPALQITCGSVFVHGTPWIAPCEDENCVFPLEKPVSVEIGDLLLISTVHKNKNTRRKALLLQAKKVSHACDILKHLDNPNQYHIYSKWPPFKYEKGMGTPSNQQMMCKRSTCKRYETCSKDYIDILDTNPQKATQYLIISKNKCEHKCPCEICLLSPAGRPFCDCCFLNRELLDNPCYTAELDTKTKFNNFISFNCMLSRFVLGQTGKSFKNIKESNNINTWDILINNLIDITGKKLSRFMKGTQKTDGNAEKGPRGQGELYFLSASSNGVSKSFLNYSMLTENGIITKDTKGAGEPPLINDMPNKYDYEPSGISIVEFVTDYGEERIWG